ncbi:MAG: PQQ-binding-like beta-propeller repeat protein [Chloroflexota bacterium]
MTGTRADIGRQSVQYPGGFAARFRWAGSGRAEEVFAISEALGTLTDFGTLGGGDVDSLCRAELRVEGPTGSWTARFASMVFDEPQGVLWDTHALLLVKYGFRLYALNPRTGDLAWSYASGTPALSVLASSRLDHVLLQTEVETIALGADGDVAWRAAHSDVITDAQLVAGRLDLTTYTGQHVYLDARTGQAA